MRTELRANVKAMMERGIIEQWRLVDEKPRCRKSGPPKWLFDSILEAAERFGTGLIAAEVLNQSPRWGSRAISKEPVDTFLQFARPEFTLYACDDLATPVNKYRCRH